MEASNNFLNCCLFSWSFQTLHQSDSLFQFCQGIEKNAHLFYILLGSLHLQQDMHSSHLIKDLLNLDFVVEILVLNLLAEKISRISTIYGWINIYNHCFSETIILSPLSFSWLKLSSKATLQSSFNRIAAGHNTFHMTQERLPFPLSSTGTISREVIRSWKTSGPRWVFFSSAWRLVYNWFISMELVFSVRHVLFCKQGMGTNQPSASDAKPYTKDNSVCQNAIIRPRIPSVEMNVFNCKTTKMAFCSIFWWKWLKQPP